jgi:polyhydroxybutyrate depolymerase
MKNCATCSGCILSLALVFSLGGCPQGTSGGDGGGGGDSTAKGNTTTQSLTIGGFERSAVVHISGKYDGTSPTPLVLLLHGTGQNGSTYVENAGWADKADAEGFILVAPDALPVQSDQPESLSNPSLWDFAVGGSSGDVAFIDAVLADVQAKNFVDLNRVYCVGHSSGGGMTFLMGIVRKDTFAAIGVVASPFINVSAGLGVTMPTIYIQGTADPIVPTAGGSGGLFGGLVPPLDTTLSGWAAVLSCGTTRTTVSNENGVESSEFTGCAGGATFQIRLIEGQGHKWPGFNVPNSPAFIVGPSVDLLNATDTIWSFLADKSK